MTATVARKLDLGRCMRCPRTGIPEDQALCRRCQKRKLRSEADIRADRRDRGMCAFCETKSATYRCPTHAIKHAKIPTVGTSASTGAVGDRWRRDGNGWERFRGKGVRGAPTAAAKDEVDLIEALKALEKGRKALAYAHSDHVRKLGRIQQADAREAAASMLAMAARFVTDVMDRYAPGAAEDEDDIECRAADAEIEAEIEAEKEAARKQRALEKSTLGTSVGTDAAHPAIRPQHAPRAR